MKSKNIDNIFISASENVAWLLNIRGKDSPNSPLPNCKIILTKTKKIFFFHVQKKLEILENIKIIKELTFSPIKNFQK